eukprot:m.145921 g.145921  ORF g.145921 m.145921 type:complete len:274 (-) comp10086_c2_seq4:306-1127(-)
MASADELLTLFASMGTTDHDTLVTQFTQVAGADPDTARFFLEANNWSLQEAISSFFEYGGAGMVHSQQAPEAQFVCDVTIGEGEEIPPGVVFDKTWRIRNSGGAPWPSDTVLQYARGEHMEGPSFVAVPSLAPGEVTDVTVKLRSPRTVGQYAASWRLCCSLGTFGEEIWVVITVAEGGTLPILQQLHATSFSDSAATSSLLLPASSSARPAPVFAPQPSPFGQAMPRFGDLSSHTFGSSLAAFSHFGDASAADAGSGNSSGGANAPDQGMSD